MTETASDLPATVFKGDGSVDESVAVTEISEFSMDVAPTIRTPLSKLLSCCLPSTKDASIEDHDEAVYPGKPKHDEKEYGEPAITSVARTLDFSVDVNPAVEACKTVSETYSTSTRDNIAIGLQAVLLAAVVAVDLLS